MKSDGGTMQQHRTGCKHGAILIGCELPSHIIYISGFKRFVSLQDLLSNSSMSKD